MPPSRLRRTGHRIPACGLEDAPSCANPLPSHPLGLKLVPIPLPPVWGPALAFVWAGGEEAAAHDERVGALLRAKRCAPHEARRWGASRARAVLCIVGSREENRTRSAQLR